jgi:arsenite/tail-anchored protein-transporting ATPase
MPPEPVDVVPLLSAAKVTVVAGKGGVGKTTVTALLARAAADAGRRVIVVELDGKPTLAELVGDLPLLALSAPLALEEYLREHGFGRVAKRLAASGVIDVVSTASPGIDDLVVLGKIKQLERSGDWDTIIVDGPAAGHAVTMLTSAAGLRDAVTSGPVRAQADDVLAMLGDASRCQVALVTLPETTPVNETVTTAFTIEDRVGVKLAPVFVNAVDVDTVGGDGGNLPATDDSIAAAIDVLDVDGAMAAALGDAARFRGERRRVQQSAIEHLRGALPLEQLHVPFVAGRLDGAVLARLAGDLRRRATVAGTVRTPRR